MNDGSMWERYQDGTYFNPERAILTDLIAELRKPGHSYGHYLCKADEAEARLREVQGE